MQSWVELMDIDAFRVRDDLCALRMLLSAGFASKTRRWQPEREHQHDSS